MDLNTKLNQLIELRNQLIAKFGKSVPKSAAAEIYFNPKMRTVLGRAYTKTFKIELNPNLLINQSELEETFAHELAHLLAVETYGANGFGHGRLWKYTMRTL